MIINIKIYLTNAQQKKYIQFSNLIIFKMLNNIVFQRISILTLNYEEPVAQIIVLQGIKYF